MKRFALIVLFSAITCTAYCQMLTPDTELISEIISKKQEEIKQRVLKNLVVKNNTFSNYTIYNTAYNIVDIVTSEKNETVLAKSLLTEIANYSIAYLLSDIFYREYYDTSTSDFGTKSLVRGAGIYDAISNFNASTTQSTPIEVIKTVTSEDSLLKGLAKLDFVVDQLYLLLQEEPRFADKGLFKKNNRRKRFTSGLTADYKSLISKEDSTKITNLLKKFISHIDSLTELSFLFSSDVSFSDLTKLDKKTVETIKVLFDTSLNRFRKDLQSNSLIVKIGDIVSTYIITDIPDSGKNGFPFNVDVEAVIFSFVSEFFDHKISSLRDCPVGFEWFFSIGMTYGRFLNPSNDIITTNGAQGAIQLTLVSEKIGMKFPFWDWEYTHSHKPDEWFKYRGNYYKWNGPASEPYVNNIYVMLYASGFLYNIVDLKSEKNFDYLLFGTGIGIEFFNGLELNISYAVPLIKNKLGAKNGLVSVGFDIPILEYLGAVKD